MPTLLPGTDIELGKWYPASTLPPSVPAEVDEGYVLLLGIKDSGPVTGFYDESEQRFYWHCERYDSLNDQPVKGWTREQQINNNLEWCYELATDVTCWMVIPDFPNFPVIDNGENDELDEADISFTDEESDARDDRPGKPDTDLPDYRMN